MILERLRPHPHRGDVIAAGAAPLSVAAFVIELRMTQWSLGPRFIVVALIAVLLLTMGWLAPLENGSPRSYHSILLVAGLLPMALAHDLVLSLVQTSVSVFSGLSLGPASFAPHVAFGWKLFLLAAGFGLIAYAGVDHERGPAFLGVAVLSVFVVLAGFPTNHGSLVGWSLFLLLIGGAGLAIGLRPRQPLPPPPGSATATVTPTVPIRSADHK